MNEKIKNNHINQVLLETQNNFPNLKKEVVVSVLKILSEHANSDLTKSEAQSSAKDLVELQTAETSVQHEKQN